MLVAPTDACHLPHTVHYQFVGPYGNWRQVMVCFSLFTHSNAQNSLGSFRSCVYEIRHARCSYWHLGIPTDGPNHSTNSPTSASYQNEAVVIEKSETVFTYQKDGTGEKLVSVRMKITSEAGARQFSVISLPYAAANETSNP